MNKAKTGTGRAAASTREIGKKAAAKTKNSPPVSPPSEHGRGVQTASAAGSSVAQPATNNFQPEMVDFGKAGKFRRGSSAALATEIFVAGQISLKDAITKLEKTGVPCTNYPGRAQHMARYLVRAGVLKQEGKGQDAIFAPVPKS